jgi:ribosomal protein S18 acetylase RimI-like enzyme
VISIRQVNPAMEHAALSFLVANYLRQTETEKAAHGLTGHGGDSSLSPRYQQEIAEPAEAFRKCVVLLATDGMNPVGMVVAKPEANSMEIKRLWVEPSHRGQSISTALLRSLTSSSTVASFRLTVWEWREPALRLYEKLGFERVESWDERPELVCLQLSR